MSDISRDEVETIAKVAAKEATRETLLILGIDIEAPLETQRDFAHLREWRIVVRSVMRKAVVGFFMTLGGTLGLLFWQGFRAVIH